MMTTKTTRATNKQPTQASLRLACAERLTATSINASGHEKRVHHTGARQESKLDEKATHKGSLRQIRQRGPLGVCKQVAAKFNLLKLTSSPLLGQSKRAFPAFLVLDHLPSLLPWFASTSSRRGAGIKLAKSFPCLCFPSHPTKFT